MQGEKRTEPENLRQQETMSIICFSVYRIPEIFLKWHSQFSTLGTASYPKESFVVLNHLRENVTLTSHSAGGEIKQDASNFGS